MKMKKILHKLYIILLGAFLALGLTACTNEPEIIIDILPPPPIIEPSQQFTIEELGETIVLGNTFWEDWWNHSGVFEFETSNPPWEWPNTPEHLEGRAWATLSPESGFESLSDIYDFLSQYYTENWINEGFTNGIPYIGIPFAEYDNVLLIDITRAGFPRPNWATAGHTLISQENNVAVVETAVLWGSWHMPYAYPWEVLYRFTLIDGRIDDVEILYGGPFENTNERTLPLTIEELGSRIEMAGEFWEAWTYMRPSYRFDFSLGYGQAEIAQPHLDERGYARMLWVNMEDIRNHLLWLYTEDWVENELSGETPPFLEYGGMLYIYIWARDAWQLPRPQWETATHVLLEQDGNHAVVKTTVSTILDWGDVREMPGEATYLVTFVGNRIKSIENMND